MGEVPLGPLLIADPEDHDPVLSSKFRAPSRGNLSSPLGLYFTSSDGSTKLSDAGREQDLLPPRGTGCGYHSHPRSACLLLYPWSRPRLAALPALPFSPWQERLAEITQPAGCPDSCSLGL